MPGPIRSLVPLAHVRDMRASIAFYEKLGFTVENTFTPEAADQPAWCWLASERAELMLARASEPVIGDQQGVLFYAYCDDAAATHRLLADAGIAVGPIATPFYMPGGEFPVKDPDGYLLYVAQI